jgi:hypothetical protein
VSVSCQWNECGVINRGLLGTPEKVNVRIINISGRGVKNRRNGEETQSLWGEPEERNTTCSKEQIRARELGHEDKERDEWTRCIRQGWVGTVSRGEHTNTNKQLSNQPAP